MPPSGGTGRPGRRSIGVAVVVAASSAGHSGAASATWEHVHRHFAVAALLCRPKRSTSLAFEPISSWLPFRSGRSPDRNLLDPYIIIFSHLSGLDFALGASSIRSSVLRQSPGALFVFVMGGCCRPKRRMYLWRAKDRLACRFRLDGSMEASRLHAAVKSEPVCGDHSACRRYMRAFQSQAVEDGAAEGRCFSM